MTVKIYIYHTIHAPKTTSGAYAYILEADMNGKIATLSNVDIITDTKLNKVELQICLKALKRLVRNCDVLIVGLKDNIIASIEKWLPKWAENEFKNAKGQDLANKEEWKELYEYTKRHNIRTCGQCNHEYLNWMRSECEKALASSKNGV